jgi:hypothetical protein
MAKGQPVKVHIMCAVNYELGPFFIEFTTGTHGIRRLHIEVHPRHMVWLYFMHGISKKSIRADVKSLPVTWHIISTLDGVCAEGPDGQMYRGTGGDWADTSHR